MTKDVPSKAGEALVMGNVLPLKAKIEALTEMCKALGEENARLKNELRGVRTERNLYKEVYYSLAY